MESQEYTVAKINGVWGVELDQGFYSATDLRRIARIIEIEGEDPPQNASKTH